MIVVDTNIIAYFVIPGPFTEMAEKAAKERWCAPLLWRSEFCNVLAVYLRRGQLDLERARRHLQTAERLMWNRELTVRSSRILECIARSNRSSYDCEFVALAIDLGLKLVTTDEPLVREFSDVAVHVRDFVGS